MSANEDAGRILSPCGSIDPHELTEAFITGKRDRLPNWMRRAISGAVGILQKTGSPGFSDTVVDRSYFAHCIQSAETTQSTLVLKYARTLTDSANLRVLVRSIRAGRSAGIIKNSLFDGGFVSADKIANFAAERTGAEDLGALFNNTPLFEAAKLASAVLSGEPISAFERECESSTQRVARDARWAGFGSDVLLGYLIRLDWEQQSLRIVLLGKLAGIDADILRGRLREV